MAKADDKMTRDIRSSLKKAFGTTGRYAKGFGRSFLASGEEFMKSTMPAPVAMFDTNRELLTEFWRTLRNPSEATNRYTQRIGETESYKALHKLAKNALEDLKTGNIYDPNRDREDWGFDMDALENDFGGFDMSGFDENGDWSEDNIDNFGSSVDVKIATAQEAGASRRTEATINAIGTSTEAITANQNAIAANQLRVGMKQHSQLMTGMQNMITQQAASVEAQIKSINAMLDVTREAHKQTMEQFNKITGLLETISANTKKEEYKRREYKPDLEIFGMQGELNLKNFAKNLTKNVREKMFFGAGLSSLLGGFDIKTLAEMFGDNPLHALLSFGFPALVPKDVKKQMERTNKNFSSFFPALLSKAADRGRRYENGESNNILDMLAGLVGVEPRSASRIKTDRDDYLRAAKLTDKTVRAIEEVIPTLLAKIDSTLSGQPMMVFDYKQGKFIRSTDVIARYEKDVYDLAGKSGDTTYKIMGRAKAYRFKTTKDSEDFQQYVYQYLQNAAENGVFINPYQNKSEFMSHMHDPKIQMGGPTPDHLTTSQKKEVYYKYLTAILKNIDPSDLQEISRNLLEARASRDKNTFNVNRSLEETGLAAAFTGLIDPTLHKKIKDEARSNYSTLSESDIDKITEARKKDIIKQGGTRATNVILQEILQAIRGGVITYSYNMGFMKTSNVMNKDIVSEQAKKTFKALDDQQKNLAKQEEDRRKAEEARAKKYQEELDKWRETVEHNPIRPDEELYAEDVDMFTLERIQANITDRDMDPNDLLGIARREAENRNRRYGEFRDRQINNLRNRASGKTGKIKGAVGAIQGLVRKPFDIFNKSMQITDALMMKALYGTDMDDYELFSRPNGEPFLLSTLTNAVQTHFKNAKDWFTNNIGDPIKKYMFDKDDGLLTQTKKAFYEMFGIEDKKERIKNKIKGIKETVTNKLRGVKGDDGTYSGGMFSGTVNELNRFKAGATNTVTGTITNAIQKLLYGDQVEGKGTNGPRYYNERVKAEGSDAYYMKRSRRDVQYSGVIGMLKKGFQGVKDFLFGDGDNELNPSESKKKFDLVTGELKKAFPNMIVGGGAGLLASLFLPGGPLLGTLIGSTLGLVKGSDKLKEFLFGETEEEPIYDKNGSPVIDPKTGRQKVKKSRKGNLIDKKVYEGFKRFAPRGAISAGIGAITSMFLPGGPLLGSIIGGLVGLATGSKQLKEAMFGKEDDKDSGLISKNFREKAGKFLKTHLPASMGGALAGGAAWSLISGIGLIPGLSLLPGGPILSFIGGMMGLANAEKINNFFFGKEEEEDEIVDGKATGKKVKVKKGGVFNKVFDTVRDKAVKPLAVGFNKIGNKISDWFQESVMGPFNRALDPMKERIAESGQKIKESLFNIGNSITERIFGKPDDPNSLGNKFRDTIKEKFLDPLKKLSDKLFSFFGKLIGSIISAPFKAMELIFTGKIDGKDLDEIRDERRQSRWADRREKVRDRNRKRREEIDKMGDGLKGFFNRLRGKIHDRLEDDFTMLSPEEYQRYKETGQVPDWTSAGYKARHGSTAPISAPSSEPGLTYDDYIADHGSKAKPSGYNAWYKRKKRDMKREKDREDRENARKNRWNRGKKKTEDTKDKNDKQNEEAVDKRDDKDDDERNAKVNNDGIIRKGRRRKKPEDYLNNIEKYTRKINGKLNGNIEGVGWNVAYITTLLRKQYGDLSPEEMPEEMEGSGKVKKQRKGVMKFLGAAKDFLTEKFEGTGKKVKGFFGVVIDTILRPFEFVGKSIKTVGEGIKGVGSTLLSLIKDLGGAFATIVKETATTIGTAVKTAIPVIGEALKGVVGVISEAARSIAHVLSDVVVSVSYIVRAGIEMLSDVIPDLAHGVWEGAKFIGKTAFGAVKGVARGIKRGVVGAASGIANFINKKRGKSTTNPKIKKHSFYIEGGYLDSIENEVPISIGPIGSRHFFPYVKLMAGKAVGKVYTAVPVYIAGVDRGFGLPGIPNINNNNAVNEDMLTGDNNSSQLRIGGRTAKANKGLTARQKLDKYREAYRQANRISENAKNSATVYDSLIINASTAEEIQAIRDVQQMNANNGGGILSAEEPKKDSWLSKFLTGLMGTFGGIGSILASILGVIGIGGLIGNGIVQDDPNKVIRGAESIANIAVRKLGLGGMRNTMTRTGEGLVKTGGFSFKDIARKLTDARTTRMEADAVLEASGHQAATRAGSRAARNLGRTGTGMSRLARMAELVEGFKYGVRGAPEAAEQLARDVSELAGGGVRGGLRASRVKFGQKIGQGVKGLASIIPKAIDRVLGSFSKLPVLSKYAGKLKFANAIEAVKKVLTGPVMTKALEQSGMKALGKATAEQLAKFASGPFLPVTTIAFAIADFIAGWGNARKYFSVFGDEVTTGMKLTSGIVNVLEGLLTLIPGAGIPLSIALTFFTDKIVQAAYNAIADSDAREELKKKQEDLQAQTDAYNKEHNTDLTTEEYANQHNSDGSERISLKTKVLSLVLGGNSNDPIEKRIAQGSVTSHANIGGKGRGLVTAMSQHSAMYNRGSRVMADAGCGPTAGAMVASAYGIKLNPEQLSNDAFASGMRAADGGLNPNYFSQMSGKYGSGFGMAQGPISGARIAANLANHQPIIMMGKGGPYGPTTHYMVAEGLGRGGVTMIDPNNGSRKTVKLGNLLKNSTASIYSWGRGSGTNDPTSKPGFKNDMDAQSLLDDDYNTPEGKLAAFGRGRGLWGRGITDVASSVASGSTQAASSGNAQVKSAIQALMGEYKTHQWTRTDTSGYGAYRTSYGGRYHAGLDLTFASNAATGRAIKSFTEGTVYRVHNNAGGRGWYIIIQDKNGYYHFYQHLNKSPTLAVGSKVGIGDTVGGYGNTGASNGNHLHYEVRPPTAAQQPGGVTGTDPGHSGFIRSKEELARYTVNPYIYLQQYMNGNVDVSALGKNSGGTTIDASGTSGTEGTVNANDPKGVQFMSALGDWFSAASAPLTKFLNAALNQSEEENTSDSTDTGSTSSGGIPSVSGEQGSKDANARYIYKFLKQLNVPDTHIAGVLSNWDAESKIDPTGVETIYSPMYKMSQEKLNAMSDPNAFSLNVMFPKYARSGIGIKKSAYKGDDGKYYPGVGLGGFTGPAVSGLLRKASEIGKPWYDIETQLRYMTDPSGSVYTRGKHGGRDWIDNVFRQQNFSSATAAARWFEPNWEGSTFKLGEHIAQAEYWHKRIQQEFSKEGSGNAVVGADGKGYGYDIYADFGKGAKAAATNVDALNYNIHNINKQLRKNNKFSKSGLGAGYTIPTNMVINTGNEATDKILTFLTENFTTLLTYVANISNNMPTKTQKVQSTVQDNLKGTYRSEVPTVRAGNQYNSGLTGGDPEDVGMRIMNSLTSK